MSAACPKCGASALISDGAKNVFCKACGKKTSRRLIALQGHSPDHDMTHTVPDGYVVKGVSTYYGKDGDKRGQWVKSAIDFDRVKELISAAVAASIEALPIVSPRFASQSGVWREDLLACYPIGDAHIGMLAWAEECGADWDLRIAEQTQCAAMDALVQAAPNSERAVIVNLGDWFHYDNMEGITARGGNILETDGRYAKMIRVGVKVMRQAIESALTKHKFVHVINVQGNHDQTGAIWLSESLAHIYGDNPRVSIDRSPAPFTYFEFGKNLIGCHHGDKCRAEKLPGVMAADKAVAWGRTEHRYWWLGHVHHQNVREYPGVTVETFNTLASKDAYATSGGWRARQNMKCIVLHRENGECARHTVNAQMFREDTQERSVTNPQWVSLKDAA